MGIPRIQEIVPHPWTRVPGCRANVLYRKSLIFKHRVQQVVVGRNYQDTHAQNPQDPSESIWIVNEVGTSRKNKREK